jgi:hypothetical protein
LGPVDVAPEHDGQSHLFAARAATGRAPRRADFLLACLPLRLLRGVLTGTVCPSDSRTAHNTMRVGPIP